MLCVCDLNAVNRDVGLAPNGTNPGLSKISFSTFWLAELLKLILKSPIFVPFGANLPQFGPNSTTRVREACVSQSLLKHISRPTVLNLFN